MIIYSRIHHVHPRPDKLCPRTIYILLLFIYIYVCVYDSFIVTRINSFSTFSLKVQNDSYKKYHITHVQAIFRTAWDIIRVYYERNYDIIRICISGVLVNDYLDRYYLHRSTRIRSNATLLQSTIQLLANDRLRDARKCKESFFGITNDFISCTVYTFDFNRSQMPDGPVLLGHHFKHSD